MSLSRRPLLAVALITAALLAGCSTGSPAQSPSAASVPAWRRDRRGPSPQSGRRAAPLRKPARPRRRPPRRRPPCQWPPCQWRRARAPCRRPVSFPGTDSAAFRNAMADLWLAVTTGNPRFSQPAFFPEAAYEKLKAIPYPAADWQDRLWYGFALDVGAAHGLVARSARLVRVIVPESEADWVYPGACYNTIGYWHGRWRPGRLHRARSGAIVRHRVADLLAWRVVRGALRRGSAARGDRSRRSARRWPGHPGAAGRPLTRSRSRSVRAVSRRRSARINCAQSRRWRRSNCARPRGPGPSHTRR